MKYPFNDSNDDDPSERMEKILHYKAQLAQSLCSEYQWIINIACNERLECPWAVTMLEGLRKLPRSVEGVDCEVRDYFPEDAAINRSKMRHYRTRSPRSSLSL